MPPGHPACMLLRGRRVQHCPAMPDCLPEVALPLCLHPMGSCFQPCHVQQAKGEIAGLSDVTATNAAVMQQELLHHQVGSHPHSQAGASNQGEAGAHAEMAMNAFELHYSCIAGGGPACQVPAACVATAAHCRRLRVCALGGGGGGGGKGTLNPTTPKEVLLPLQERAEEVAAGGSSEELMAASVQSNPSTSAPPGTPGRPPPHVQGSTSAPSAHPLDDISSRGSGSASVDASFKSAGSWGSAHGAPGAPRTPGGLTAADIVSPMRDFASEVAAEVGRRAGGGGWGVCVCVGGGAGGRGAGCVGLCHQRAQALGFTS